MFGEFAIQNVDHMHAGSLQQTILVDMRFATGVTTAIDLDRDESLASPECKINLHHSTRREIKVVLQRVILIARVQQSGRQDSGMRQWNQRLATEAPATL